MASLSKVEQNGWPIQRGGNKKWIELLRYASAAVLDITINEIGEETFNMDRASFALCKADIAR